MDEHYRQKRDRIEDFWGRTENAPRFKHTISVFGVPVRLSSNERWPLAAGDISAANYSQVPQRGDKAFSIQFVVRSQAAGSSSLGTGQVHRSSGQAPDHLIPHIQYTGSEDWVHLQLGAWGSCFADLGAGQAWVVLDPQLARRPEVLSAGLLNTLLNNFLTRHGHAMLHATALLWGDRALLLMAPHNGGKSTTALRLALSGHFRLLTDSQVYLRETPGGLQMTGFPVGSAKLRSDQLGTFPQLGPYLVAEEVRDETKFRVSLRNFNPSLVCEEAFFPAQIDWCLLERTGRRETAIAPAAEDDVREAAIENSLHADSDRVWAENLRLVELAIGQSQCYHLRVGTEPEGILEQVLGIFGRD